MSRRDTEQAVLDSIRDWGRRHPVLDAVGAYAIYAAVAGVFVVFPLYCLAVAVTR